MGGGVGWVGGAGGSGWVGGRRVRERWGGSGMKRKRNISKKQHNILKET